MLANVCPAAGWGRGGERRATGDGWRRRQGANACYRRLTGEEHNLRDRKGIRVRDGHERRAGPDRVEATPGAAVEFEAGRTVRAHHFDVTPPHLRRVPRAKGFHRRFLRSEASGKMSSRLAATLAVGDLTLGEDPLDEALAVAFNRAGDARDVRRVEAEADDGGHANMILPAPDPAFEWRDTAFGPALVCLPLEEVASHLFTSRVWPLGEQRAARGVWADVAAAFGGTEAELVRLQQVHRAGVVVADTLPRAAQTALPEADIVLAREAPRVIAVQGADCVPLLVADRRLGVVAAAHAGWRGLAQGVPRVAIAAMADTYGSDPSDLVVAVGPSVGACCYEVGQDVRVAFAAGGWAADALARWFVSSPRVDAGNPPMPGLASEPRPGHVFFDGWACAREQLRMAGIPAEQIFSAGLCTASHDVLCSYRRDGVVAGRIAGAIMPAPPA